MTIRELRKCTKCHIFIQKADTDGTICRAEYTGGRRDWEITELRIIHVELVGFALCVELGEEV